MFSSAMKDEAGGIMCQGVGLTQINNSESFFKLLQDTLCKLNNFFIILGSHTSVQTTWHFGLKKMVVYTQIGISPFIISYTIVQR
jgi:hypothetical protein